VTVHEVLSQCRDLGVILNRTARDSYTHAPEPECRSVRHAHENSGVQGRRAHSARYAGCANLMHLGLGSYLLHDRGAKFCPACPQTLDAAGVRRVVLPARSPNLNAHAER